MSGSARVVVVDVQRDEQTCHHLSQSRSSFINLGTTLTKPCCHSPDTHANPAGATSWPKKISTTFSTTL
jgi:hypothetical protein